MSKNQVLTEFYYREIPLLINRIRIKRRNEDLEKLHDKLHTLHVLTATAGMCPDIESIEKIKNIINESISKLSPAVEKPVDEDPYDMLRRIQKTIADTKVKRR
jgi:CRISPR/Cas system CSM-associated protein Csm2 small subunit